MVTNKTAFHILLTHHLLDHIPSWIMVFGRKSPKKLGGSQPFRRKLRTCIINNVYAISMATIHNSHWLEIIYILALDVDYSMIYPVYGIMAPNRTAKSNTNELKLHFTEVREDQWDIRWYILSYHNGVYSEYS